MGGFKDRSGTTLTFEQIAKLHRTSRFGEAYGRLDEYLREINDKSKSDPIVKAFACVQAVWFLDNIIARAATHLPVSPLELVTCGYIPGALTMFYLWWHKPYGVTHHIVLPVDSPSMEEGERTVDRDGASMLAFAWMCIGSLLFGACHLIAWNYVFINNHGQTLWRVSSLLITLLPSTAVSVHFIHLKSAPKLPVVYNAIALFVYCVARMSLIILLVLSFWNLPMGVYEEMSWAAFIPTIR